MSRAIEAGAKNCFPRRDKFVGKQNGLPCLPFGLAPMEAAIGSYNDENQKALAIFGLCAEGATSAPRSTASQMIATRQFE